MQEWAQVPWGLVAKPTIKSCGLGDACDLQVRSSDEVAAKDISGNSSRIETVSTKVRPRKGYGECSKFLEIKSYYPQVLAKLTASSQEQSSLGSESTGTNPTKQIQKLVFLYAENVRGSQTMGMELLRQQAAKQGVAIEVSKEPLETVFLPRRQPT